MYATVLKGLYLSPEIKHFWWAFNKSYFDLSAGATCQLSPDGLRRGTRDEPVAGVLFWVSDLQLVQLKTAWCQSWAEQTP